MSLSALAQSIAESPTLKLNEEAQRLRDKGEAVINLGVGEPKNKAPINAILTSAAKLVGGDIKYVPADGLLSLKKSIIRYTEENYDRLVGPDNVIVATGAKQALFNVLYSILNPQDEVVVLAPYWVSYPEMIRMAQGRPVIVRAEDGRFQPTLAEVESALTSATKALILNSPNNPSGAVFDPEFVRALVERCERKGIYLILDDIYHKLIFDRRTLISPFQYTDREINETKLVVINGVSKLYGMTGFRIGWTVASRDLIRVMTNVQAQTTSCVSPVLQAAAEGALNGLQTVVESLRLTMENNRNVMVQELESFNGVKITRPGGTFYCFPDFSAYNKDSVALSNFLLKKAMVVTVPGKEFGMEGYLRLSFSGTVKEITEGIARMKWALDPHAPNEIYVGDRKLVRDWM